MQIGADSSKGVPTLGLEQFWCHLDNLDFRAVKMIAFTERIGCEKSISEGGPTRFQAVQDLVGPKFTQNIRTPSEKNAKTRFGIDFCEIYDFH